MAHARLSGQGDFALGFLYSEGGKIRVGVGFSNSKNLLGGMNFVVSFFS